MLNEIYVKHTGQSYAEVEATLDRDHFMSAEEAKKWGLIDKVIERRAGGVLIGRLSSQVLAGATLLQLSAPDFRSEYCHRRIWR